MIEYFMFIAGLVLLWKGADFLVDGSSSLAKKLNVSAIIIGLTVLAFGTSMPELMINIFAALNGTADIAVGSIVGSNIANILLVLGICAVIYPVKIHKSTIWKEVPFGILAAVVLLVVINDQRIDGIASSLSRTDGLLMLFFFLIFVYYVYEIARKKREQIKEKEIEIKKRSIFPIIGLLISGGIFLYLGGEFVVENALIIAKNFNISTYVISAFAIAIGTSLPELTTAIIAIKKKNLDLAVGNVIGSNIFNIFWVLGVTASITPIKVSSFVTFDVLFLIVSSILLFLFAVRTEKIKRKRGLILIALYIIYLITLIMR